jgi:alkyl hydroperoxide reductase subunit F
MALDNTIKMQLKVYLEKLTQPIAIKASVDSSAKSNEMMELLNELASLSDKIHLSVEDNERKPSFSVNK